MRGPSFLLALASLCWAEPFKSCFHPRTEWRRQRGRCGQKFVGILPDFGLSYCVSVILYFWVIMSPEHCTDSKTRNLEPSLGHPGSAESQVTMGMKTDADEDKLCDRVSAARALGKSPGKDRTSHSIISPSSSAFRGPLINPEPAVSNSGGMCC